MKNVKKVSAKATLGQNPYNAYLHIGTSKSVNNSVAKATFSGSGNLTVSINASSVTSDCYVFIQDCTYVDIRVNQIWIEC